MSIAERRATGNRNRVPGGIALWFAVLGGLSLGATVFTIVSPVKAVAGFDFQAFWCGGSALLHGANPYLNEPLHACEVANSPAFFMRYPNMTIPDPLPPYAIAVLAPLSLLPFTIARALWWMLLVICAVLSGRGIAKITGMDPLTAFAASGVALLAPAVVLGSLAPVPITLVILGALALRQKRWNAAAVLLGFAMMEPHVALPACAATFIFVPQMRFRLMGAGIAAAIVMMAAVGPHDALRYFTSVLPLHAFSEINSVEQYSLAAMLYHLGVAPGSALWIGSLQYVGVALAAVSISGRLYRKSGERAVIVLLPAAFAVIGGAFIHLDEMAMAIPLACLFAMWRPGAASMIALILLAIPFSALVNWAPWAAPAALACGWLMLEAGAKPSIIILSGLVIVLAVGAIVFVPGVFKPIDQQTTTIAVASLHPGAHVDASRAWANVNARFHISAVWWPERFLALAPLGMLVWFALAQSDLLPAMRRSR